MKPLLRKLTCYFLGHKHVAASLGFAKLLGAETCDRCGHTQYSAASASGGVKCVDDFWKRDYRQLWPQPLSKSEEDKIWQAGEGEV